MLSLRIAFLLPVAAAVTCYGSDALSDAARFPEVVMWAKDYGIDYPAVVRRAADGNVRALNTLFHFTRETDGAAAEGHCSVLRLLMERLGDRRFSSVLRRQSREVRSGVTQAMDFDFGRSWRKSFPITYALGSHDSSLLRSD
jgi:hypothetical protein